MPSVEFYFGLLMVGSMVWTVWMIDKDSPLGCRVWFEVIGIVMLEYSGVCTYVLRMCWTYFGTSATRLTDRLSAKSHKCKFKGL